MVRVYQPLGHRVLVRLKKVELEKERKTAGGIIYDIKKNKELELERAAIVEAYVIAIGSTANKYLDSHDGTGEHEYQVGDLVNIGQYAGKYVPDIFDEDEIYRLVKDIDILAKYPGESLKELLEVKQLADAL